MAEICSEQVLPTLLTSRKPVKEAELKKPKAQKVIVRRETLPEAAFGHSISVKNTFVDYKSQRSPSLEPFVRPRMASSCPSSPAVECEGSLADEIVSRSPGREHKQSLDFKDLREACSGVHLPVPRAAADGSTRCPSMSSPADWQFFPETSPSEARSTPMAQFAGACVSPFGDVTSPFHAGMYTPMCGYPVPMGGDAFCLAGPSPMAPIMQPPATPVAQPSAGPVVQPQPPIAVTAATVGRPQVRTGHTILSLADAISEPTAPPTLSVELNSVVPVAAPLGSPRAVPTPPAPPSESPLMSAGGSALAAAMATAAPPSPPKGPALGSAELPSVGSAGHSSGDCKPCAFFHTAGCSNGVSCQFCHTCDANEKKRRRKEKIQRERMACKAKQAEPSA